MALQRPAITTVAGMFKRKGIAELIEAFTQIAPQFPEAHLYLVGNGDDRALFEAQAEATSVANRIHFEGFQPQPQRYLLATDIFVLASHKDPSPLVIPEAREAGCAIVASQVDGIPEALDGGKAGWLIPPKNRGALATTLQQLLSNAVLLNQWKNQANQNLQWLSIERVHQETLTIYQELTLSRSL
jgi:glycosyltransferase involved in cell wall biosynthesis